MLPTTMEDEDLEKGKSNKEKRREKEGRRRAQRSSLIQVREILLYKHLFFSFRFVSHFCPRDLLFIRCSRASKVAYNQTVLNLGQWYCRVSGDTSIKKWTFSFLFLSEIYFTRAIVHIVFNYISNTYYNFKIHRNSHTSSVKTLKKFVMEMQTTETPSSSANTLAWKLARELKKICLRVFR